MSSRSNVRATALLLSLMATAACPPRNATPTTPPTDANNPGQDGEAVDVAALGDEVFEAWFSSQPVTATAFGDHRFDGAWPDLSPEGLEADRTRIDAGLTAIEAVDREALGVDEAVDLGILQTELERQRFVHDVEKPWNSDPLWYATVLGNGLEDLVSRDYAPITDRAQATAARLEALPGVVDQALANLQPERVKKPHAQVAIGQLAGIEILIDQIIPARVAGARPADRERVEAARAPAVAAIKKLSKAITDDLLPEAQGQWRLGEHFEAKLQLTLGTDLSASEVRTAAQLEHARVRREMATLARELGGVLFSKRKLDKLDKDDDDDGTALVSAVLEALADDRVSPPRLRDQVEENLARLRDFVSSKQLVTLDDAEVLKVIWTPPHQRGVFIAGLAAPGPLDAAAKKGLPSFYLVQPVPDEWPPEVSESFLREYNNFMIEILSIHEAIPGHFVQLYYAKREPSKIRKILANGAFVEGWAVYAEKFMVDAGYAGAAPPDPSSRPRSIPARTWKVMTDDQLRAKAIALHGLKFYLRSVTNAILDHSVHAGTMTQEEAIELMVERSFQQEGEARAKWVRAQVTSTQLSTYFVGAQAWHRLRNAAEARSKGQFDLRAFHDAALSHGAPPVHRLPELMWAEPKADANAEPEGETPAETPVANPG